MTSKQQIDKKQSPPLYVKIIYGTGDMFGSGAMNLIGFYYLIFLTDVMGIRPGFAGIVFLISKAWDAVSDPLMGVISDNTRSRFGRRRPYFFAGFFLIILSLILLWTPVSLESTAARFLYVLFTYLLFSSVLTLVLVPYSALMPELSSDYDERTVIHSFRVVSGMISTVLCAVLPMVIVRAFSDIGTGYTVMGAAFGLFYAVPFLLMSFLVPENPSLHTRTRFSFKTFLQPIRIRSFRILVLIYIGAFITIDILAVLYAYFMTYVLARPEDLTLILGTLIVTQIFAIPFYTLISRRLGKNRTFFLAVIVWIVSVVVLSNVGAQWPLWAIMIVCVFLGFGLCGGAMLPWAMFPDTTDVGELVYKRRIEGSFSGIMTFFRKASSAVAIFIVSLVLEASGYIQPETPAIAAAGVVSPQTAVQPDSVITAIRVLISAAPICFLSIAAAAALRYPLTAELHGKLRRYLTRRKEDSSAEEELEELKAKLL